MKLIAPILMFSFITGSAAAYSAVISCDRIMLPPVKAATERQQDMIDWRTNPNKKEAKDYMSLTNPSQSGTVMRTNTARERALKDYALMIKKEVLINDAQAIGMEFLPEVGVRMRYLRNAGDYESHQIAMVQIGNLGPTGVLRATMGLPVSGRYGQEKTLEWANTDLYEIYLQAPNGQKQTLISRAPSRTVITVQEIEIPLVKDTPMTILYNRLGSAGPLGFPEGRTMILLWDGT